MGYSGFRNPEEQQPSPENEIRISFERNSKKKYELIELACVEKSNLPSMMLDKGWNAVLLSKKTPNLVKIFGVRILG